MRTAEIVRTDAACFALHMKLWLDDQRGPPDGNWNRVATPAEAIVEELSLVYEVGLCDEAGREQTGY